MNLDERIDRRLRTNGDAGVVRDLDSLTPGVHVADVTGRGPALERLLDALDPAFTGSRPPTVYVHGPKGTGKSAVVVATFARLSAHGGHQGGAIHTTTRAVTPAIPEFVHVDARNADTTFGLYRDVLAALSEEPVPEHGVGTAELAARLDAEATPGGDSVVVAVDHTGEARTSEAADVATLLAEASDAIVPICVGRKPPSAIDWRPDVTVEFPRYRRHTLVDVITARASTGLSRDALTHDQVREIAEWADGDAHDALAAACGAAIAAVDRGHSSVLPADVDRGVDAVPKPCISLGQVLALPENRKRVLYELVGLSPSQRGSVSAATEEIAAVPEVDLSASTVRRVLYELAEAGILERVRVTDAEGKGRPPSRVEPQFPTLVFSRLFGGE